MTRQFRLVHIAPYLAKSGNDWFTIQRDDYFPLRWPQVADHRAELEALIVNETVVADGIGNEYSEWKDWSNLPEWAVEPLE